MFDENALYRSNDPKLNQIVSYSTLASYRHEGRGPEYVKIGNLVFYKGSVLNAWIDSHVVKTKSCASNGAA